jgi:hypothetical protein
MSLKLSTPSFEQSSAIGDFSRRVITWPDPPPLVKGSHSWLLSPITKMFYFFLFKSKGKALFSFLRRTKLS